MSEGGRKDDTGKLRYDLIPVEPLRLLAEVYTIGCHKYEDRNWEKGLQFGRLFAAMMRHAWKWWAGKQRDEVDGQHHLASVAWTAFALMELETTHPEMDDRPIKIPPTINSQEAINAKEIDVTGGTVTIPATDLQQVYFTKALLDTARRNTVFPYFGDPDSQADGYKANTPREEWEGYNFNYTKTEPEFEIPVPNTIISRHK